MSEPILSKEQVEVVEKFEFNLSLIKEQDLLYNSFRVLIKELPNDYELGATIRKLFNQ
jgi:hypothetical protein